MQLTSFQFFNNAGSVTNPRNGASLPVKWGGVNANNLCHSAETSGKYHTRLNPSEPVNGLRPGRLHCQPIGATVFSGTLRNWNVTRTDRLTKNIRQLGDISPNIGNVECASFRHIMPHTVDSVTHDYCLA